MKSLTAVLLFVIALICGPASAETVGRQLCGPVGVPISVVPTGFAAEAVKLTVTSSTQGTSASMDLVSRSAKPLLGLFAVLEFSDNQGIPQFEIPFFASVRGSDSKIPFATMAAIRNSWLEPIIDGEQLGLAGTIQQATSRCPFRAEITMLFAIFSDSTHYSFTSGAWTLTPYVSTAQTVRLRTFPATLPRQVVAKVAIDRNGTIEDLNVPEDATISEWLRAQMSSWRFHPAFRNGKKVASNQILVFRLHRVFEPSDPETFDDSALARTPSPIPIEVFPYQNGGTGESAVFVGDSMIAGPGVGKKMRTGTHVR
jgi:hypothetical protein